jgi:small-conductance mechanosensitive channel
VILLHFEVTVGVDYSSDIQVIQILKEAVDSQNNVLMVPNPFIRFTDFGILL